MLGEPRLMNIQSRVVGTLEIVRDEKDLHRYSGRSSVAGDVRGGLGLRLRSVVCELFYELSGFYAMECRGFDGLVMRKFHRMIGSGSVELGELLCSMPILGI
jgi:hypothetical protein